MYFVYDVQKPQFGVTVSTVVEAVRLAEANSHRDGSHFKVRAGSNENGHEIGNAFHGMWHGVGYS